MAPCSTSVVLAGLCSLASAEAEALSLLQHAAHAQRPHLSGALPGTLAAQGRWMGGFFHCDHAEPGVQSGCAELQSSEEHPRVEERSVRHVGSESSCASFTKLAGGDTFNFEKDQRCQPLICNGVNMKFSKGQGKNTVYSLYCGMQWVNTHFVSKVCGYRELGYHVFSHPPARACDNELKFNSVGQNDLDAGGALVFQNVLTGIDLSITAPASHAPEQLGKTGLDQNGFGKINIQGGEETTLTFRFLKSGTQEVQKVDMFTFTIADLETADNCIHGQFTVSVSDFAGYYLAKVPAVDVKVVPGDMLVPASASFSAIVDEQEKLDDAELATHHEARRSISLFYKRRSSFDIKVSAPAGGRNLKLGGSLLMTCDGSP